MIIVAEYQGIIELGRCIEQFIDINDLISVQIDRFDSAVTVFIVFESNDITELIECYPLLFEGDEEIITDEFDHQIIDGYPLAELQRIVIAAVDDGVFAITSGVDIGVIS